MATKKKTTTTPPKGDDALLTQALEALERLTDGKSGLPQLSSLETRWKFAKKDKPHLVSETIEALRGRVG